MILRDRNSRTLLAVATIALLGLFAGTGCTDADVIRVEASRTSVSIQPLTSASTLFESGTSGFSRILVVPVDPDAVGAIGGESFGLVSRQVVFDIYGAATVEVEAGPLRPGSYRVREVVFRLPALVNDDPLTDPAAACVEKVAAVPGPAPIFNRSWPQEYFLDYSGDADAPTFLVSAGDDRIVMTISYDDFIPDYLSRFLCTEVSNCQTSGAGGFIPPPCLVRFNGDETFRQLVKDSIEFD